MENKDYKKEKTFGNVKVVENTCNEWAVLDKEDNIIVPFGKYGWIDGFDSGLARVRTNKESGRAGSTIAILDLDEHTIIEGKENIQRYYNNDRKKHSDRYAKWGIINERGEEVLPLIYDNIWNFLGKNRYSTKVEKAGETFDIYFCDLNPSLPDMRRRNSYSSYDSYGSHYGEYSGSYAQDVMGYSDEAINDAFEGDPDNYWNID